MSTGSAGDQTKARTPKCARCRNHGYTVNLRGHKGFCPHKNCACELCDLVKERQEVSKRQIKLRRQQLQEEVLGMYVPVPPSVFSQGSACGINLDYLRVLFPRKRVDRLYAVLLQCNNDVNAATVKLQQEEYSGEKSQSLFSLTTKTSPAAPVVKINKATQWPVDSEQDKAESPSLGTLVASTKAQQQSSVKNEDNSQQSTSSHCPFPYSWPHAVPAQFTPTDSMPSPSGDNFGTTSTPQTTFSSEPFRLGISEPLEEFESTCGSDGGPLKALEQTKGTVAALVSTPHLPETSSAAEGLVWSVPDMSDVEPGCATPSCIQLLSTASKVSHLGGGLIYTSASSTTSWLDAPASIPVPRMAVPFSLPPHQLPPPTVPPFPPGWDPRSLTTLPFLPASVASIFHTVPYSQMASSSQLLPAHLPHSSAIQLAEKEVVPNPEKAADVLTCHNDLILTAMEREVKVKLDSQMDGKDVDINILDVCSDSEQFIDPNGFN